MPQQKLAEPMPSLELVLLGRLPRPDKIPQRLMLGIRHPHRREVSRAVAARQLDGVPPVGLHSVARLDRYERRCHDVAVHPHPGQLPVQNIARRPCLVADPQSAGRTQFLHQLAHRFRTVGDDAQRPSFPGRFRHRYGDRLRVYVQPHESGILSHRPAPFVCSSALRGATPTRSVTYDAANRSRSFHPDWSSEFGHRLPLAQSRFAQ